MRVVSIIVSNSQQEGKFPKTWNDSFKEVPRVIIAVFLNEKHILYIITSSHKAKNDMALLDFFSLKWKLVFF